MAGMATKRNASKERSDLCTVEGCGRPRYARGLCQTHRRKQSATGKLEAIRPYRRRSAGTLKFAGLRLSPSCAVRLRELMRRKRLSESAAIAEILEEWNAAEPKDSEEP